jgi:hypothetical protein
MTPFLQNKWNPILKVFTPEVNFIMKQGVVYSRIRVTRLERPVLLLPLHKMLRTHHHHHISVMELGHLLTLSGLTYPEDSSKVCHDFFCQLGNRTWDLKTQSLRKQFTFTFFLLHNGNTRILQLHWSTKTERKACWYFKRICKDFLGNHKATKYQDVVQDLLTSYKTMGCNRSLKIHFLQSHLDFFPENLGELSDEHGERIQQDLMAMEKWNQGKWTSSMLADYCSTLKRDVPDAKYRRKSYASTF